MKKMKRTAAALLLTAVVAALYCNYALDSEDWQVESPNIPEAFDGLRITLLTDLHGAHFGEHDKRLLEAVTASGPDLIALSGDIIDESTQPETVYPLLQALTEIAPVYYVTGNHEWIRSDLEQVLEQLTACGVTVLRNQWVELERDGQKLVLAGAEDRMGWSRIGRPEEFLSHLREQAPEEPCVVLLYHRNVDLELWAEQGVTAVLSGHGHGGAIRLPLIGGLLAVDRTLFPDNCEGLYTVGETTMAVSRGLGGLRLWNRPHLPTVVLRRTQSAKP